jgi:simple sugar transport system ATP-binding protein
MVGRTVLERIHRVDREPGEVILDIRDVEALNDRGLPALRGATLQIRAGEIVGLAAVAGNGQAELAEAITGLRDCRGSIVLNGEEIANRSPGHAIKRGMGHVPEDRTSVGSAPNLSIVDNAIMKRYRERPIARGWILDRPAARALAERLTADYQIAATVDSDARLLSGGNLQRLILAREIERKPGVLVAVQPTRGLDVGAIETVHQLLLDRRAAGAGILLISEELDELIALADRIDVMYEGRIVGSFPPDADLLNEIGLRMTSGAAAA